MNFLKVTGRVMIAVIAAVSLTACPKKKSGSVAATPGSTCTWNPQTGAYVNSSGVQCSPSGQQTVCPQSGINPANGQVCTPGQVIYPTQPGYPNPNPYPQQAYGCHQWQQVYGVPYVPLMLNGQYHCVRYDLVHGYTYNTNYWNYGYDYYFAYPPHNGRGCNTQINLGGSWGQVGLCF